MGASSATQLKRPRGLSPDPKARQHLQQARSEKVGRSPVLCHNRHILKITKDLVGLFSSSGHVCNTRAGSADGEEGRRRECRHRPAVRHASCDDIWINCECYALGGRPHDIEEVRVGGANLICVGLKYMILGKKLEKK